MSRCFISHATADRPFVETELIGLLNAFSLEAWYAEVDIRTAEDWQRSIAKGLESTDLFMLIMSPRSAVSEWVKDEVTWAFSHRGGRIIPVLIERCEAEKFHLRLPRVQHVDFTVDAHEARLRLIRILADFASGLLTGRFTAIIGTWNGTLYQDEGPDGKPAEVSIGIALRRERRAIVGDLHIVLPDRFKRPHDGPATLELDFSLTGDRVFERYVQLNYLSNDPTVMQFGSMVLELSANGKEMNGKLIGYGAYSQRIVSGRIVLAKSK